MKKIFLGLGSLTAIVAPVAAVVAAAPTEHKRAATPAQTEERVFQWGVEGYTIEHPRSETLQEYIARKGLADKARAIFNLDSYKALHQGYDYFLGSQADFDAFQKAYPIRVKADKGQEVENAIELNKIIADYWNEKINAIQVEINADFVYQLSSTTIDHNKLLEVQALVLKQHGYIDSLRKVNAFEVDIAIQTNSDPTHSVDWLGENEFVQTLEDIYNEVDKTRWVQVTKLIGVEISYEPENIVAKYKEMQLAVNNHIVAIYQAAHTLSSELANSHTGAK